MVMDAVLSMSITDGVIALQLDACISTKLNSISTAYVNSQATEMNHTQILSL